MIDNHRKYHRSQLPVKMNIKSFMHSLLSVLYVLTHQVWKSQCTNIGLSNRLYLQMNLCMYSLTLGFFSCSNGLLRIVLTVQSDGIMPKKHKHKETKLKNHSICFSKTLFLSVLGLVICTWCFSLQVSMSMSTHVNVDFSWDWKIKTNSHGIKKNLNSGPITNVHFVSQAIKYVLRLKFY